MSPGYLLLVGEPHNERDLLIRQIAERSGLVQAFANHRIVALVGPSCACCARPWA